MNMCKWFFLFLFLCVASFAEIDFKGELDRMKSLGSKSFDKNEKADLYIVDFWASWCDPCKESFPYYEEQIKAVKGKKIVFISVNLDDKIEKAKSFLKENPQSHISLWDEKKSLMEQLGFDSIPFLVILDQEWKEKEQIRGFNKKTKKRLEKYFQ